MHIKYVDIFPILGPVDISTGPVKISTTEAENIHC